MVAPHEHATNWRALGGELLRGALSRYVSTQSTGRSERPVGAQQTLQIADGTVCEVIEVTAGTCVLFPAGWTGEAEIHETIRNIYMLS